MFLALQEINIPSLCLLGSEKIDAREERTAHRIEESLSSLGTTSNFTRLRRCEDITVSLYNLYGVHGEKHIEPIQNVPNSSSEPGTIAQEQF